jgi:hypothetical protein
MGDTAAGDGSGDEGSTGEEASDAFRALTAVDFSGDAAAYAGWCIAQEWKEAHPNATENELAEESERILNDSKAWDEGGMGPQCRLLLVNVLEKWSNSTPLLMGAALGSAGLFALIKGWADANPEAAQAARFMRLIVGVYTAFGVTLCGWPHSCGKACHVCKRRYLEICALGRSEPGDGEDTGSTEEDDG